MKTRIGIIGGGNMGSAIISGIRKKYALRVCEKDAKRRAFLKDKFRLSAQDLKTVVESSNVLILAVKPQDFDAILGETKRYISKRHLVISIAAGITTRYIEKRLGKGVRVMRTMPNLPAQVGMGMTGICKGKNATRQDAQVTEKLFQRIGFTIHTDEKFMDAVTAVSGSGPAYVFYFVESFVKAAQRLGFSQKVATGLIMQTLRGSLNLLVASNDDAATLRQKVTSKKGTTEAALKVFQKKDYQVIFSDALKAARKRAKELSK
ncbi:MAG TPA: pyrroline-5-carboxylate reductase [Candidatus Omnitrophota bacterium]|nr:pyrroline-5-carboxylate reductase [Candidatus Omnitrophota bacterium]